MTESKIMHIQGIRGGSGKWVAYEVDKFVHHLSWANKKTRFAGHVPKRVQFFGPFEGVAARQIARQLEGEEPPFVRLGGGWGFKFTMTLDPPSVVEILE